MPKPGVSNVFPVVADSRLECRQLAEPRFGSSRRGWNLILRKADRRAFLQMMPMNSTIPNGKAGSVLLVVF